jgi:hypothetical protein
LRRADAILFGAMGLPHVRGTDGTEIIPQLDLRFHFDLYAGVRPIRTFVGLPTPLSRSRGGRTSTWCWCVKAPKACSMPAAAGDELTERALKPRSTTR